MRVGTLLFAASVLLSSAASRAQSSAVNLHFNPTLALPQVGGGLNRRIEFLRLD